MYELAEKASGLRHKTTEDPSYILRRATPGMRAVCAAMHSQAFEPVFENLCGRVDGMPRRMFCLPR